MFVIEVSNIYYGRSLHGPWRSAKLADQIADRWNGVFARRGWPLRASVRGVLDQSAATRDRLGALLIDLAAKSHEDELLRMMAKPCECTDFQVVADSVSERHPEGVCRCGHDPDEHDGDTCDGMVLPTQGDAAPQETQGAA